jgi:sugar phosphate isomerase/epimerase
MLLGIDSYCYHRYFGDCYPWQPPADQSWTVWDFLDRAHQLGVAGVSLEACYLPTDAAFLGRLRDRLDALGLHRVWAWGHPRGLCSGTNAEAAADLRKHLDVARALGADVMRIVGGSRHTRPASWTEHRDRLVAMLRPLAEAAAENGVTLALENHTDLATDELLEILAAVNLPALGVCLDTGNQLRVFEDPLASAERLAPFTRATHVKDVGVLPGNPREFQFWPSVPLGRGLVDPARVVAILRGAGYRGLLAIEIDFLHPEYGEEDTAVAQSVATLRGLLAERPA